jgi:transcriptional regulator of acetoin/glycerol metabolism
MQAIAYGRDITSRVPSRHNDIDAVADCAGDKVYQASHDAVLQQARLRLTEYGDCSTRGLDDRLLRSWQRSLAAGLRPRDAMKDVVHVQSSDLRQALVRNHDLLAHSQPVMEYLFEQVRHAQGMVILADRTGTLMHTLGHASFLDKAQQVALSQGASWLEQHRGTNAIGTALEELAGVEIHGAEHFLERNTFLTCTAAPILSGRGELMGVLDISGDHRSSHPHTLGLVSMAARMIENRLLVASTQRQNRLHLHARREGLGTVAEGILVLSGDGWIVGANRHAMELLDLSVVDLSARQLSDVITLPFAQVLARQHSRPGQPMPLRLHSGVTLYAVLQTQHTGTNTIATPNSVVCAHEDALSRLDTGDIKWRSAAEKTRRVLDKPIPLLIQGESGVGKELFARAAHDSGPRATHAFVAINCAAVPENLIEAELFGYAPGSFTGARREGSPGRLREAHGGTLFLDEIGDMPLPMQARLLRVLQERQVTPLGGGKPVEVDFALVCASHRKLRDEVQAGRFRSDLYYRINGLTVVLPPLRERTDFEELTTRLLEKLQAQRPLYLSPELSKRFKEYEWPGNLRQYSNVLRTASAMLSAGEDCIAWEHLPEDLQEELTGSVPNPSVKDFETNRVPAMTLGSQNLQELSRQAIRQAIEGSGGNMSQAARLLGISRQTLYRKLNG